MEEPKLLWTPDKKAIENSNLSKYIHWLKKESKGTFNDYQELWEWSVNNIEDFWATLWDYFNIAAHSPYDRVLKGEKMPFYEWFPGATLNYAEHIFRNSTDKHPALIYKKEDGPLKHMSWDELSLKVTHLQQYFKSKGVGKGDCVVAYIPNCPEAIISFLATSALGATWSSCSPDFGTNSIVDRFAQIEPKILIAVDGYQYGGKKFSRLDVVDGLQKALPSLSDTIVIPYLDNTTIDKYTNWDIIIEGNTSKTELTFEPVPFEHPLWVLYSSGTTGIPKAITQGHGGILLEHLKYLSFHNDVHPGERCFWYTTTGWMMWNYIVGSLLCGGTVVLYDGSPAYPDLNGLWEFAAEAKITHFGTSAGYIVANMKEGLHPGKDYDLSHLRSVGSTGSPLPPEGFDWLYEEVKDDLWLTSISGGTDVCSAFVGGNPLWPVYSGEIQCRALGCKLKAFDDEGNSIKDEVGEMVITEPMPSMPVFFWNDEGKERYQESYFEMFPGTWRHGDWIRITSRKGIVIYGRSDATLNRGGVRIGTSEVYRAVDKVEEIRDSIIVCIEKDNGEQYMPLFVITSEGKELTEELKKRINKTIREEYSPRHVPDEIIAVPDIPYTISGKKVETPVKKILMGKDTSKSLNTGALRNPESLKFFRELTVK